MPPSPNIILILMDDLGQRDLGCYGSTFYETPHLDRLARQGMRFDHAYASCPVCSPTRASVMTGQYPARVGITNYIAGNPWGKLMGVPFFHALPHGHTTVAQALRQGGYQSWHVGKWHLGPRGHWPEDFGFDVNVGGCHRGHPPSYFSPYDIPTLADGPPGEYLTDRLTDESIRLIRQRDPARPFFLNLWHYAVHTPIQAPADLVEKYRHKARALGLDKQPALQTGEYFPCLHKKDQRVVRRLIQSDPAYAAMIENLDGNIGRLLEELDRAGLRDNTLVIFTSDNGGLSSAESSPTTNLPLCEGKGWMYDGGIREPLLARLPGLIPPGVSCQVPVTSTDFYPTFLELAGLPLLSEQHTDGVSLLPILRGGAALGRQAIFWHYPHYSNQGGTPACAVRSGPWKLIEFFEDARLELYDLVRDVGEERNLAGAQPEIAARLHGLLKNWRADIEAKIPQPNPRYAQMLSGVIPCPNSDGIIPGTDR